jgi:hypothetical protein
VQAGPQRRHDALDSPIPNEISLQPHRFGGVGGSNGLQGGLAQTVKHGVAVAVVHPDEENTRGIAIAGVLSL